MKSVTARQFYHNASLVDGLPEGKKLIVTSNGKTKFIVSKGSPPRMTRELAKKRAFGGGKKFDSVAFLRSLR